MKTKRFFIASALIFLQLPFYVFASNIISATPLTDKIILVHFKDGYIRHHLKGEIRANEWAITTPLNVTNAGNKNNYNVTSPDDANYSTAIIPSDLGRKTKGTDFSWACSNWGTVPFFGTTGCINPDDSDNTKEHWIYLYLTNAMQKGKTYVVNTGSLASNGSTWSFVFNEAKLRSEAVHVNNVGYSTSATLKYGYVYHWLGDKGGLDLTSYNNNAFSIIRISDSTVVYSGNLVFRKSKTTQETGQTNTNETPGRNFSGADIYECDFSALNTPGEYVLSVNGIGCSFPFEISCDVFRNVFHYVMKGLYQQRSGIALIAPYTTQPRPAPHNPLLTPGFNGKLKYTSTKYCDVSGADADKADTTLWNAGIKGNINVWGWYQDAGDWDGYLTHSKIPTLLMFLYENFGNRFFDDELNIPESGNGIPDVLDEARWLIRFYKRVKDTIQAKGWGTGGVGGARVMGDLWGGDERPDKSTQGSWEDTLRTWIVSGEDAYTTYKYAGLAAHFAYCLQLAGKTDVEGINWQQEAINAYSWASSHLSGNPSCHGFSLRQMRMYAAANLYKLTGTSSYNTQFVTDFNGEGITASTQINDDQAYGPWTYATMPAGRTTNATVLNNAIGAIQNTADLYVLNYIDYRGCRWGGNYWQPLNCGHPTTPKVVEGVIGYAVLKTSNPSKAADYLKYLHTTADYFLGTNPLNMTWITGLGERYPMGIFHMDSWYNGTPNERVGIIPYGPWVRNPSETYLGPWSNRWPEKTVYPLIANWPGHERWFDQQTSPMSAEFTVHENLVVAAAVYGALCGDSLCYFTTSAKQEKTESLVYNFDYTIYPNPASSGVTLNYYLSSNSKINISVFDLLGRNILNVCEEYQNEGVYKKNITTENIQEGLYFIVITTENKQYAKKLIIQKKQ
ncbi:MAG: glycoside hydrolase family 9 protein [Bacteroidales bacterium]|nr:glycoside hydrolase family 9 protein [Bacteroidales bacterium]